MNFDKQVFDYLDGNLFSSGLNVTISHPESVILNRFDLLEDMVKGKHVVHIGCVDHLPLIDQKIKNNLWLHSRLCQKSSRCFGVDINLDGVNYIRDVKGYKDVICADITSDDISEIKNNMWDYMLLGEILEHVENPCHFLSSIQKKYSGVVNRLIITVPNAFAYLNLKYTFKHKECINSDHKYWFTPYTLAKLATMSNMKIESFDFCEPVAINESFPSKIINWKYYLYYKPLLKRYPSMRETLVMVLKL
jgi:hypothetical protein